MLSRKWIICRPEGGLNDVLCQIGFACDYAEAHDRTVVVQTDYFGSRAFRDKFSLYFESQHPSVLVDMPGELTDGLMRKSVYPAQLRGRVSSYQACWSSSIRNFVDGESGVPLTFDFANSYEEDILLHHACGGGLSSCNALARLQVAPPVIAEVNRRIKEIGPQFTAIHLRNTDYKTSYRSKVEEVADEVELPLFVATDNVDCLTYCVQRFGRANVFNFSTLPGTAGQPIHAVECALPSRVKNTDAIADFLLLCAAKSFIKVSLDQNSGGVQFSGFALLAEAVRASSELRAHVLKGVE